MRKRLVRIRHAVRVFLLLHRVAAVVCRVENLGCQTIGHRLLAAAACVRDDPANCQGTAPFLVNFDRNLISRTANSSRFHFNRGLDVVDGALENLQWLFAGLVANLLHRVVEDGLSAALLALPHHAADEFRHERAVVYRIWKHVASFGYSSSWHIVLSLLSSTFGPLRSVLRSSLLAIGDADRVEGAANHVIPDTGEVLHAATSDQNNRALLKVMTDAGNVSRHFNPVSQAHASDFAQR